MGNSPLLQLLITPCLFAKLCLCLVCVCLQSQYYAVIDTYALFFSVVVLELDSIAASA